MYQFLKPRTMENLVWNKVYIYIYITPLNPPNLHFPCKALAYFKCDPHLPYFFFQCPLHFSNLISSVHWHMLLGGNKTPSQKCQTKWMRQNHRKQGYPLSCPSSQVLNVLIHQLSWTQGGTLQSSSWSVPLSSSATKGHFWKAT